LKRLRVVHVGEEDSVGEIGLLDAANRVGDANECVGIVIGSGLITTAFTTLKIAVVAPMPSARVMINPVLKAGRLASARQIR
jgi:hypothetical protein